MYWGPRQGSPETTPDLFLEEAIAAARRGVAVRILLSDSYLDPTNPRDNTYTVQYVNEVARKERLNMQARLFRSDLAALDKIHNKGIIVDGTKVLVSSINWSYNSPANNREVGLILDHPTIGSYYTDLFTYDWYNGTTADYPLITEVDGSVGFLELTHFGLDNVDISGWRIVTHNGALLIPSRTTLIPGRPLVLTRDPDALRRQYGTPRDLLVVTNLAISGERGYVRLQAGDRIIDQIAWGEAQPGWLLPSPIHKPLCRENPGKDTNTLLDWIARQGSPGLAGCGL